MRTVSKKSSQNFTVQHKKYVEKVKGRNAATKIN